MMKVDCYYLSIEIFLQKVFLEDLELATKFKDGLGLLLPHHVCLERNKWHPKEGNTIEKQMNRT